MRNVEEMKKNIGKKIKTIQDIDGGDYGVYKGDTGFIKDVDTIITPTYLVEFNVIKKLDIAPDECEVI